MEKTNPPRLLKKIREVHDLSLALHPVPEGRFCPYSKKNPGNFKLALQQFSWCPISFQQILHLTNMLPQNKKKPPTPKGRLHKNTDKTRLKWLITDFFPESACGCFILGISALHTPCGSTSRILCCLFFGAALCWFCLRP